jgi:hypothetical protein
MRAIARGSKPAVRPILYKNLPPLFRFRRGNEEFVKISNAFCVNDTTGKDAIFALNDLVIPMEKPLVKRVLGW